MIKIPELDQIKFFSFEEARKKIVKGQKDFLDRLENKGSKNRRLYFKLED